MRSDPKFDGTGILAETSTQKQLRSLDLPFTDVEKSTVDPTGTLFAFGRKDQSLVIWDTVAGQERMTISFGDTLRAVAFSFDGARLAGSGSKGHFGMWDVASGVEVKGWRELITNVVDLQFTTNNQRLACGHEDGSITVWNLSNTTLQRRIRAHPVKVNHIALTRDGSRVASTSFDRSVAVYDLNTGKELVRIDGGQTSFFRVFFSADGKRISYNEWDNAYFADVATGRQGAQLKSYIPRFFDDDGVLGLSRSGFWVWHPPTLQQIDERERAVTKPGPPAAE